MLAELVDHVIGVDPDRDWITLAVIDAHTTGVIAEAKFPATSDGYRDAVDMVDAHSSETERAWAIEGSASYGRGLAAMLSHLGEWVIEFGHPTRKTKDGAKSDVSRRHPRRPRGPRPGPPRRPSSPRRDARSDPCACRDQGRSGAGPHRSDQRAQSDHRHRR